MSELDRRRAIEDWRRKCVDLGITRDRPPCDFETGEPLIERGVTEIVVPLGHGRAHTIVLDWSGLEPPAAP